MVNKHIYSTGMYISLIVNVSVSLMVSGVLPHMTVGCFEEENMTRTKDVFTVKSRALNF